MAEKWRPIPGYEGRYEISNFGEIRSYVYWNGRRPAGEPVKLTPFSKCTRRWKYLAISLDGKRHAIKSIMRDVWMGGPRPGMVVTTKDGDYTNVALHNLIYTTQAEIVKKKKPNRRPVAKVSEDGTVIDYYCSVSAAARKNHLSHQGMTSRIHRSVVVDGVKFRYDDIGG